MAKATQLWKTVGITNDSKKGLKVRFGDDYVRCQKRSLKDAADIRCTYIELSKESTKIEALNEALAHSEFQSADDQFLLTEQLNKRVREATPSEKRVRVAKTAPSLEAIKARANKRDTTAEDVLSAVIAETVNQ